MGLLDFFSKNNKPEADDQQRKGADTSGSEPDMVWQSFLLNESKFGHQKNKIKRSSPDEPVTLGYILEQVLNISPSDIGSMAVVRRGEMCEEESTEIIESPADVLAFRPFDTILRLNENGEPRTRLGLNAILIIAFRPQENNAKQFEYKKDKSTLCSDNSIIMYLRDLGSFAKPTAYMRVSVMIPNFSIPDDFRTTHSKNAPFTTSFILGHDFIPPEERMRRFEEIERSVAEKAHNNEPLVPEEIAVLEGAMYSRNIAYEFGYGRLLVNNNRYVDALLHLHKVYEILRKPIITDTANVRGIFEETCYNIGFCYNELEDYDRAIAYLSILQPSGKVPHIMEYINALVNSCDPRALATVKHHLAEYKNGKRNTDSREDAFFFDYLMRRLAYLYIEYEMYDSARTLLEDIKNMPSCRDFALGELQYLDHITRQSK